MAYSPTDPRSRLLSEGQFRLFRQVADDPHADVREAPDKGVTIGNGYWSPPSHRIVAVPPWEKVPDPPEFSEDVFAPGNAVTYTPHRDWLEDGDSVVDIGYLKVSPSQRRQGIGRALLEEVSERHPGAQFVTDGLSDDGYALMESLVDQDDDRIHPELRALYEGDY